MDSRFRGNDNGEGYFRPVEDEIQHDCDIRLPYHEWFLMPVWCFFNRFSPRFYSIPMEIGIQSFHYCCWIPTVVGMGTK